MKVLLMYGDRDFDPQQAGPANSDDLIDDLGLSTLFATMAQGDEVIEEVARKAITAGVTDVDTILYRQAVLTDALANASVVRSMYELATTTIADEKKHYYGLLRNHPDTILRRSVEVLQMFVERLRALRQTAEQHVVSFHSEGFTSLFLTLQRELDNAYLARIDAHLKDLRFRNGVLISAGLGPGNIGQDYVLRKPHEPAGGLLKRLFTKGPPSYGFTIPERDDNGFRALDELRDKGVNLVANALAQSNDHILGFFRALRTELAFYVGAVNLHEHLQQKGEPTCFPVPHPLDERRRSFDDLYDASLSLYLPGRAVGNEVRADGRELIVITGANHGGKSTFLRSIGIAQLMMQCGMFVPATSFTANVCDGLFTHFKREEDRNLESGKLDEELARMSTIVDALKPRSLVLFNESFAATNEREGSEIASQITTTLLERGVSVCFVTHLYEFARQAFEERSADASLFLRADRTPDGKRTFKLLEGEPLATSYGEDLYREVFSDDSSLDGSGTEPRADWQAGSQAMG